MLSKRFLSAWLVFALVLALMPASVLAAPREGYEILQTWSWEIPQHNAASISAPALAAGNHEKWIDRIGNLPDFASSFYAWLEENASQSGALADPSKGTALNGIYVHVIETIQGSVSYRSFSGATDQAKAEAAIAADLGNVPSQIANYAAAVYGAFDRDHAEVFWLSGSSSYGLGSSYSYGGGVVNYTAYIYFYLKTSSFDLRKPEYQSISAISAGCELRDQRVAEILGGCTATTDADKVIYLNDMLTKTNAYNSAVGAGNVAGAAQDAWECVSALEGNTGTEGPVCEGYARAFKVLCDALAIPCVLAEGPAAASTDDDPAGHMWNLVQVDGAWYAVDVTWNDPYVFGSYDPVSGYESSEWLLLGSQSMYTTGLTFAQSHQETNKTTTDSLEYVNGPILSADAYAFPSEVVIPNLTLQYPSLLLESEIRMAIYFDIDQPDFDLSQVGLITWSTKPDVVDISTAEAVIWGGEYDLNHGYYKVFTQGIPAQELGDDLYFCVFAKLADGSYTYSRRIKYCPMTCAYNQLSDPASTAETKALYVAMLNYGAAAQVYLNYRTDSLINSNLTEELLKEIDSFRDDMILPLDKPNKTKQGTFRKTDTGFSDKYPTVLLDCAFAINYYFQTNETVCGDVTFYVWDQAACSVAEVLSAENAVETVVLSTKNDYYLGMVSGIAARDVNSPIYVCAVYTDEAGNQYSSGVLSYSLGYFCASQAVNGPEEIRPIAQAIAVYGFYAMNYFA